MWQIKLYRYISGTTDLNYSGITFIFFFVQLTARVCANMADIPKSTLKTTETDTLEIAKELRIATQNVVTTVQGLKEIVDAEVTLRRKQPRNGTSTCVADDSTGLKTQKKKKNKHSCLFGSPLTCCCWMTVCIIGLFFAYAFVLAVTGDHGTGQCPAAGTSAPSYKYPGH